MKKKKAKLYISKSVKPKNHPVEMFVSSLQCSYLHMRWEGELESRRSGRWLKASRMERCCGRQVRNQDQTPKLIMSSLYVL